jgi:hypothetical protein
MDKWEQSASLVLTKLEEFSDQFVKVNEKLVAVRLDIAKLKVKSGIWGLIAGAIPVGIGLIMYSYFNIEK